jgi:hypothetical protein
MLTGVPELLSPTREEIGDDAIQLDIPAAEREEQEPIMKHRTLKNCYHATLAEAKFARSDPADFAIKPINRAQGTLRRSEA